MHSHPPYIRIPPSGDGAVHRRRGLTQSAVRNRPHQGVQQRAAMVREALLERSAAIHLPRYLNRRAVRIPLTPLNVTRSHAEAAALYPNPPRALGMPHPPIGRARASSPGVVAGLGIFARKLPPAHLPGGRGPPLRPARRIGDPTFGLDGIRAGASGSAAFAGRRIGKRRRRGNPGLRRRPRRAARCRILRSRLSGRPAGPSRAVGELPLGSCWNRGPGPRPRPPPRVGGCSCPLRWAGTSRWRE
jgi:hypothetical protein